MTTAAPTRIEVETTWNLDPVHSVVGFRVKHFGLTWLRGKFTEFGMSASVDAQGAMSLSGSTPVQSISFPNEQLHGHLMSPDFFDAELHPTLSFQSTTVDLAPDGSATIVGDLTMRGTTKSITLEGLWSGPLEGLGGDTRIGLEIHGELDRTDFGISWAAQLPGGADVAGRKIQLEGAFELVRQ